MDRKFISNTFCCKTPLKVLHTVCGERTKAPLGSLCPAWETAEMKDVTNAMSSCTAGKVWGGFLPDSQWPRQGRQIKPVQCFCQSLIPHPRGQTYSWEHGQDSLSKHLRMSCRGETQPVSWKGKAKQPKPAMAIALHSREDGKEAGAEVERR